MSDDTNIDTLLAALDDLAKSNERLRAENAEAKRLLRRLLDCDKISGGVDFLSAIDGTVLVVKDFLRREAGS